MQTGTYALCTSRCHVRSARFPGPVREASQAPAGPESDTASETSHPAFTPVLHDKGADPMHGYGLVTFRGQPKR